MKFNKTYIAALFLSSALLLTSCEAVQNSNHQQRGTAAGAASGAVIGGILGNNVGKGKNAALGAVLGGIIGGVTGNVIGSKMDKQAKDIKETLPGAEVERVGDGIKITMNESIVTFAFDSSELTALAKTNLDKLTKVLVDNPDTNINIYGHTDSKGADDYNQKLSERRAASTVEALKALKVDASKIKAVGYGETKPVASNDTVEGRAENRRVEAVMSK